MCCFFFRASHPSTVTTAQQSTAYSYYFDTTGAVYRYAARLVNQFPEISLCQCNDFKLYQKRAAGTQL